MIRDEQGSMTAFLAMLFLVFLLLISICVEGIYLYVGRGKAAGACMSGLSHTRGNYQRELGEMYHVYALDPRYREKMAKDFQATIKESLTESRDSFKFQAGGAEVSNFIHMTDQQGEVLKYQIRQLMKYESAVDMLAFWKSKLNETKKLGENVSGVQNQMEKSEMEAEQQKKEGNKESESKENESETGRKDPRKGLMSLLREGSVSLIMGSRKVSDQNISIVYGKADTSKVKSWNFMSRKETDRQMEKVKKISSGTGLATEFPSILYSLKYFHCLTNQEKKEGIQYEIEYLISGKSSEKECLGSVFWKMIGLRFLTNVSYVYRDPAKQKEAAALAASILGITGIVPLVSLAKNLLLAALAYGESVVDVRNLAEGKEVPFLKDAATWQMSFSGLATLTCKTKPVQQGMSYEDYLMLLLIMQKDKKQRYFRMMDLMEQNIRRQVPDFRLNQCAVSYRISVNLRLNHLSFGGLGLPFGNSTGWKFQRTISY